MKFFLTLLFTIVVVSASSVFEMSVTDRLSPDFLTGFESGIFLRNSEDEFKEYGCPTEKVDVTELKMFRDILPQAKAMLTMATGGKPDPTLEEILTTVELFVDSVENFIGVFDRGYAGGDFCAGLTFGMQGVKVLEKTATTLYEAHLKQKAQDARINN